MEKPSIKLVLKSSYNDLSKKERTIASYILKDPKSASRLTINEMAQALNVATSTVFQFTRKLGYAGFRDFRNDLLAEEFDPVISIHENVTPDDDALGIAQKVFTSSIKSLQDTSSLLTRESLGLAAEILTASSCVTFFGMGGSNVVAFDAYHKFMRSPLRCQYGSDLHIQLMQASLMTERDCAVVITHTGLTKETLNMAKVSHDAGARIISITSYPSTPLKQLSDVMFISASEETGYRSESLSSRISQLAIIDSLFTEIMFQTEHQAKDSLRRIRHVIASTKQEADED